MSCLVLPFVQGNQLSRTSLNFIKKKKRESQNEPKPLGLSSSRKEFVALEVIDNEFQENLVDVNDCYYPSVEYQGGLTVDVDDELMMGKIYPYQEHETFLPINVITKNSKQRKKKKMHLLLRSNYILNN